MAGFVTSRTQIVCLHEGKAGRSIDPVFIRTLIKKLAPTWIRPWPGNNVIRTVACGSRSTVISKMPQELKNCLNAGGHTTLMVWADLDDDMADGEALRREFWTVAQQAGITREQFDQVVFIFAKDRLENWIEFLQTGTTNESVEGQRVKHDKEVADAATELAKKCQAGAQIVGIPASLEWSCRNWQKLKNRVGA